MQNSDIKIKHSLFQDAFGVITSCSLIVLGLILLKTAKIATGGIAGVALILSYKINLPVGTLFTLINIPFFIFGYFVMGRDFTIKTILANLAIMLMSIGAPAVIMIEHINPIFASIFGGIAIGVGILGLARHGTGSGGTGILALYLQRNKGINAGQALLASDAIVLASSLLVFDIPHVALSILSAITISAIMVSFHKPGLYTGY